jgi:hypothetical protein
MPQTLCFRRKIQDHDGYFLVSVPPSIARFLNCKEVDIIVENGTVIMNPVHEDSRMRKVNYDKSIIKR